jgi:hypothetical protein
LPSLQALNSSLFLVGLGESYTKGEFCGWGDNQSFRPRGVHDLVSKNFRPGQQHDAHEVLRTIVDMMKKDQTKAFRKAIMKHYGMEVGGEGSDPKLVELVSRPQTNKIIFVYESLSAILYGGFLCMYIYGQHAYMYVSHGYKNQMQNVKCPCGF